MAIEQKTQVLENQTESIVEKEGRAEEVGLMSEISVQKVGGADVRPWLHHQ